MFSFVTKIHANGTKTLSIDGVVFSEAQIELLIKKFCENSNKPNMTTSSNGTINGLIHSTDNATVEFLNNCKEWRLNGELHRTDGPAIEYDDGSKYWFINGKRHRTDGPAVELADGAKRWYLNDKLHRTDGPAIEYADGEKYWYLNGKELTEAEFNKRMS